MSSLPLAAGTYAVEPNHSQLGFAIRHLGISTIRGSFTSFTGSLVVGADLASTSVNIEADMASAHTGNSYRDGHLQGDQFFDTENHPKMTFTSTGIAEKGGADYALTGDLTIRGVTQPVTLDVSFNGSNTNPMNQTEHYGFGASGKIDRMAYGVSFGAPMVSENVDLHLDFQFVPQA